MSSLNENSKNTVADLIEELEQLDPNMQIGLSSDDEGNSYSPWIYPSVENNIVILYPAGSHELEDFEDYVYDEDDEE